MGPEGRICQNYSELIAAFIDRRHDLGMSQGEIDHISGLQEGYTGKIEAWTHQVSGRGLGPLSLPLLMRALGVVIVVKPMAQRTGKPQLELGLEGQLELPLMGGKTNALPREHSFIRVAPPPPRKVKKPSGKTPPPAKPVPRRKAMPEPQMAAFQ